MRRSIPAGYRLAVDVGWTGDGAESPALLVELSLEKGGAAACSETTRLAAGALPAEDGVTRAELDIPYDLNGEYGLRLRVTSQADGSLLCDAVPGSVTVY